MKKAIRNIAEIFSGVYLKPALGGNVHYVQSKHFKDGMFNIAVKPEVKYDLRVAGHLLQAGDVLLAIKGSNNFAFHYKGIVERAVASSTFIVIRLFNHDEVLPDYFAWYLNHPQMQLFFKNQARGTDILSITIKTVKELSIDIPSVKRQRAILELDTLRKKEKHLIQRIANLHENQLQHQLLQATKE